MSVVTEEMLHIAITEYWNAERKKEHAMRAALAAVAPLIAKAERERCIAIAHKWSRDGQSPTALGIIMGIEGDET